MPTTADRAERSLAEVERVLMAHRLTRERLIRELEELRENLRRVRDAAQTEGDDRV